MKTVVLLRNQGRLFSSNKLFENITIRIAGENDVNALAVFGRRSFEKNFGRVYSRGNLETFFEESYSTDVFHSWIKSEESNIWLAELGSHIYGYILTCPCSLPHKDVREGDYEIKRLYVHEDLFGKGTAGLLMRHAMSWIEQKKLNEAIYNGSKKESIKIYLGCFSENLRALKFYNKHHFCVIGEYYYSVGDTYDLDYIMRKEI